MTDIIKKPASPPYRKAVFQNPNGDLLALIIIPFNSPQFTNFERYVTRPDG